MKYVLTILGLICVQQIFGQEAGKTKVFSLKSKNDKFIRMTLTNTSFVKMEGYNGNDIVIESSAAIDTIDLKLTNITPIDIQNKVESTTIAPYIREDEHSIFIVFQGKLLEKYLIKVPQNAHISVIQQVRDREGSLVVENLTNEVELKTDASLITIANIAGPLILNARSMSSAPKKIIISDMMQLKAGKSGRQSLNIVSLNHDVDFSLKSKEAVKFDLITPHGDVYSNLDLTPIKSIVKMDDHFYGQLNGGDVPVQIRTEYGNIYIRKIIGNN